MTQTDLTRRGLFAATGATLALAAFSQRLMAATPPGVLIVGQIAEPKSLDPAVDTAVNDFRILVNLYEGLTAYKPGTLDPGPGLAESWDISDDGTVYTFHLRKGVKFHDGSTFDAEAVKFNFDRMLDDKHPFHDTGPFPLAFFFSSVKTTEAVDSHTVKFTLKEPYAPFLSNLAYPTGLIVSPAAVKKFGKDYGRHPVGTGPFKFIEWKSNERVVIDRFEGYWGQGSGTKAVIFRPVTDANTRTAEMLAGGIDLMVEVPPTSLSQFKNDQFKLYEQVGPHVWFLILDCQKGPFKDKKVRQAANYAINKEAICKNVLEGTASVANGPVAPAFAWAYDKTLDPYPYDPEKAKSLLKEAGVAEGTELTFYVTEGGSGMLSPIEMGTAIQADLAKVGLKAKIQTFEWNTFLGKVNPGLDKDQHVDMAEMAWMTNDPDTLPYLTLRTGAWPDKGGFNSGYYSNPEVDKLLEEARTSTDQSKRAELYKKMAKIVHDDAPWVFVANWKQNAVSNDMVEDFQLQPSFLLELASVKKT